MVQDATRNFIAPLDGVEESLTNMPSLAPGARRPIELDTEDNVSAISVVVRALDSSLRIRILLALNERPHFVHELVQLVGSSQPLVSQHLKVLKAAHLVNAARRGRQMTYSIAQPMIIDVLKLVLETAESSSE